MGEVFSLSGSRSCEVCGGPVRVYRDRVGRWCSRTCWGKARAALPFADRFWSCVDKNGPVHPTLGTRCWVWLRGCNRFGYGAFTVAGKGQRAHRVSWEMAHGPIPDGLWLLHKCDNPKCVNPDHAFLGTALENARDREAKGRGGGHLTRGDRNGAKRPDVRAKISAAARRRGEARRAGRG